MYEYSGGPVFPSFLCINSFNFCNTMLGALSPDCGNKDKLPFGQFLSDFSYSELKYALSLQIGIFINQRQK